MKNLKILIPIYFIFFSTSLFSQNAAPSMHLVGSFSSDAMVKMQKIKIVKSAQASYFEVNNFNGGYCGLQQVTSAESGSTNTLIASLWDTNTAAGIYARTDYHDPSTVASRFGGEGDGAKTMNPYAWEKNIWYNIVNRSWKSEGRYYVATFIQNLTTGDWFHTSTLSRTFNGYLGSYNDAFMENWISTGQYERKAFFKDCFYMNTSGSWGKATNTRFSANDSQADINRNGIYHNSFNAYYDATEDAFCMEHGGDVERDAAFNNGRTRNLGEQLGQTDKPVLSKGEITTLTATNEAGVTTINWEIDNTKSPQLSARVDILDSKNKLIIRVQDTIPHKRSFEYVADLEPGEYTVKLNIRDIFNQIYSAETTNFTVVSSPYLSISEDELILQSENRVAKAFDILSNTDWTISSDQDWLSCDKISGNGNATIKISASDFLEESNSRSATITVSADGITSKQIAVTQNGIETWYYILNQRGWSSGDALVTKAMTGTELGIELTSKAPINNNYAQQWKIVKNGNTDILLINRLTGLAIDKDCKACEASDNYYWRRQTYSGSRAYPGYRIISKDGSVGIHASGTRIFPYNYEVAECFWAFKTAEELFEQPTTEIKYSYDNQENWYYIQTPGRTYNNYLTEKGLNTTIVGENFNADNDAQLWKFVDLGNGSVRIVSKQSNGQIAAPSVHLANISLTDLDQEWTLEYQGEEQYHIINTEFQLNMSTSSKLISSNGTELGDASCWIFEEATPTSVENENISKISVFVVNKKIHVSGTNLKPRVFTISGQELDASKTLSSGTYIVKIANKITKIII